MSACHWDFMGWDFMECVIRGVVEMFMSALYLYPRIVLWISFFSIYKFFRESLFDDINNIRIWFEPPPFRINLFCFHSGSDIYFVDLVLILILKIGCSWVQVIYREGVSPRSMQTCVQSIYDQKKNKQVNKQSVSRATDVCSCYNWWSAHFL